MDRRADAVPHLEKGATLVRTDGWLFARLGVAYLEAKAFDKARTAFEEAVRVSPTPAIWSYTAWNRAEHGQDLARAAELAQKTLNRAAEVMAKFEIQKIGPQHFDLVERVGWSWSALGWLYYQNGDMAAAERYIKSAWMLLAEPAVAYQLGQLYEKTGRSTDAATAFLTSVVIASKPKAEAQERVKKYFGPGADMQSAALGAKGAVMQERTVKLPFISAERLQGGFVALLKHDGTVAQASFVFGDEKLRSNTDSLKKVQFPLRFPDTSVAHLPILVRVRCDPAPGSCFAFSENPRSSRSTN